MIKKANKRILFRGSLFLSGIIGAFTAMQHKDTLIDLTSTILDNPILGIEKVYAEDGCSGCSGCACDTYSAPTFPSPIASGVSIGAVEQ